MAPFWHILLVLLCIYVATGDDSLYHGYRSTLSSPHRTNYHCVVKSIEKKSESYNLCTQLSEYNCYNHHNFGHLPLALVNEFLIIVHIDVDVDFGCYKFKLFYRCTFVTLWFICDKIMHEYLYRLLSIRPWALCEGSFNPMQSLF